MGVISRAIPTLLRGVSQTADSTKQSDHADIQDNATSSPTQGLKKRSGVQYLANLQSSTIGNVHIQTINRDTNERYVAVFGDESINIYGLDGTPYTTANNKISIPDGLTYLDSSNPRADFRTVTIADYTFVVNTTKTVAMSTATSSGTNVEAIVFVNQVTDKTEYVVDINGSVAIHNSDLDTNLSTSTIASKLRDRLLGQNGLSPSIGSALTGFTIELNGPVMHIKKNDNSDFTIDVSDTQGNTQLTLVKDTIQRFTDLPTVAPNNFLVEVRGDDATKFDNYYVKFKTNNGGTFEEGQWEETLKAGITYKFDDATMPHVLIRKADGNFIFAKADGGTYAASGTNYTLPKWGERTVGDLDSAPNPSFVGSKINNILFFRNRLGFLADDDVILSRVSEFFNFFPETATTVIDSDPIDVSASHTKVSILKHAVTMGEQLILFSDQTQFILSASDDALTPKTANILVATEFENSSDAAPVGAGSSIYYLTKKGSFAGVREYITQADAAIKDASDITIHIPRYIPSNVFKLAVSTNEDVLVLLGTDNPNKLYINRWLYGESFKKVLNSWSTFTLNPAKSIRNIDFIGTDLYMVIEEANNTTLEKLPFEPDYKEANTEFEYHLDHKATEAHSNVSVTFNSGTSTFTLPYRLRGAMKIVGRYLANGETSTYVDSQGNTKTLKPGQVIQTTNATDGSTTTVTATGDYRNSKFIIGEPYEMQYRFSKQRITEDPGKGEIIGGRLQLHHFYLKYESSGFFRVEVTPENRDTSVHKFTGRLLGSSSSAIGAVNLETGTFRFPIMSRADRVDIDVKNDTYLPTKLSSAEFEAMFHMRSRRI
tara:strand:+ start:720 stop:3206 length:2487 start_codon:yes stop_codon:yes gene_type:complete